MATTRVDYDLLAVFVAVANEASFSKAARKLGVGKAAVSRAIARLEESLGAEVLHRTTHKVALSTAGTALYERTAPHLAALDDAVGRLPERAAEASGDLRMTAPPDFGVSLLPPILSQFALRCPHVRFDVRLTAKTLDLVAEGFDLAIRARADKFTNSTLTARKVGRAHFGDYASPAYLARRGEPRAFGESGHDWIVFPPVLKVRGAPKDLQPRFLCDDFNLIRRLVREGCGVGGMPSFLASPDVAAGALVPVLVNERVPAGADFFVVYPSSGRVPRKVAAFRDFLIDRLKERPID